jgi:hypothetical protein
MIDWYDFLYELVFGGLAWEPGDGTYGGWADRERRLGRVNPD